MALITRFYPEITNSTLSLLEGSNSYSAIQEFHYSINQEDNYPHQGSLDLTGLSVQIPASFLPFEDKQEAGKMYDCLTSLDLENLVKCHGIIHHRDKKWLIAVEPIETMESYFTRKFKEWKSNCFQGIVAADKASWFNYIEDDLTNIFQNVKRAYCAIIDYKKFRSIYANNPEECLMITIADKRVKLLPNADANKSKGTDIDKLQQLMSRIIGLPFMLNDVAADSDFKLPNELVSFLHSLSSDNLKFVSLKFLLGAPFAWREIEGYRFIVNLDDLMKRHVIQKKLLDEKLKCGPEAAKWASNIARYPVLLAIYNYPGSSQGTTAKYELAVDVVRYCSNVYRHYNDDKYGGVRTKALEKVEIEKELRAAIPDLYVNLFEALLLYAKSKYKREAIFEKLLSSEEL